MPEARNAILRRALERALEWYAATLTSLEETADELTIDQRTHNKWTGKRCTVPGLLLRGELDFELYKSNGCHLATCPSCSIYRNYRQRASLLLAPAGYILARELGPFRVEDPLGPKPLHDWTVDRPKLLLINWVEYIIPHSWDEAAVVRQRTGFWWSATPDFTGADSLPESRAVDEKGRRQHRVIYNAYPEEASLNAGPINKVACAASEELEHELETSFDIPTGILHPKSLQRTFGLPHSAWEATARLLVSSKTRACRFSGKSEKYGLVD